VAALGAAAVNASAALPVVKIDCVPFLMSKFMSKFMSEFMSAYSMKKLFAALVVSAVFLSAAMAQTLPPPTIAAKSWILLDATSGQVIASQEPGMRIEPASLTKIMTAYLTFAALKDKKLNLQQMVNVSVHAWKVDPSSSKMFIDPATPVSIDDLLHGLMVQSGNDAAVALAEAVAGDEGAFVAQMNREAERMGLASTHFGNPHGLPSAENYSTAQDLSVLAARVIADYPDFYKIDSIKSFTYNKIAQPNRNRLLWLDPTVDGMKTGHTEAAGFCMIASAKRNGGNGDRRLISVVLGTNSDSARTQESQKLLNWGFQNFDTVKLYSKGQAVDTPAIWKGTQNQIKIGFNRDTLVTLPKGVAAKMKSTLERKDPLVAPIAENTKVGVMKLTVDGKVILELPVVTLEQVTQAGILGRAWDSVRLWTK
jgi:D-alanyl-D-alanine carboxypeptidase (penicillin-binding protein 5/6)